MMELEAKYAIPDQDSLTELLTSDFWQDYRLEDLRCEEYKAIYLDTTTAAVAELWSSVRLRKEGENAVVTFKWPVGEEAAISAAIKIRGEYNLELKQENFEHWQNELLAREDFHTQVPPELVVLVRENMLFPRYQAIFKRHHAEMRFGTSLLELAIDVGYLQAGQAQEDISELEIELIEGQAEDLTHFCEKVTARFALQALQESKFTRLLALEKRMLSR